MENNAPGSNLVAVGYLRSHVCSFVSLPGARCHVMTFLVCTARLIAHVVISGWVVHARCMFRELRKHRLGRNVARWVFPVSTGRAHKWHAIKERF